MDYLFSVFWKDYHIGSVFYEDKNFYYLYDKEGVLDAKKDGFDYLIGFPNIDEMYVSQTLFPFFKSRIVNSTRYQKNSTPIDRLLEMEGKLITDNYRIVKEKKL